MVVTNARIWTGDPKLPEANSLVVHEGRFVFVGDDARPESWRRRGFNTEVIDAKGARLIPGLIDAHLHLVSGGLQLSRLNLRDVPDRAAFIGAVAERVKKTPKGEWILGGRWSTESWPDPAQPTKEWIDAVTPDHPVLLSRMDGHGALANSVALKIAGIDRNGPSDPPGGQIERDPATGESTGILKDAAIDLVEKHIPPPTVRESRHALIAAMKEAHRHGITSVHTMSEWRELAPIEQYRNFDMLTLRVRFYVSEHDWPAYLDRVKAHKGDDMLRVCGFKEYADGSLGSRTAYMADPYSDNPPDKKDWRGLPRPFIHSTNRSKTDPNRKSELHRLCQNVPPLSIAVHCIGDEANSIVLAIYARVFGNHFGPPEKRTPWIDEMGQVGVTGDGSPPSKSMRLRIEHVQHLLPSDIPRFAQFGVVASMQPLHKADDARYAEKAIGPERCKTSYAFRSLLDAGAHVAFGSDWPVVSLNPFLGIHAAVTGESLDGKVFVPEQNITVEEALQCYTSGAAYAAGDDDRLGRIKEGYLADFAILDRDIFDVPAGELKSIGVKATYVGGRAVWTAP
ncbi:MAG TPA: amidohydrolase [Phycisphaerae bacterium]|nr:amidohydrolase [Phycisphaerae bacterium]